ncbi:MAG: hypothetical protein ACP5N1_03645 [Candidatus Woesearchaeota archaeon]
MAWYSFGKNKKSEKDMTTMELMKYHIIEAEKEMKTINKAYDDKLRRYGENHSDLLAYNLDRKAIRVKLFNKLNPLLERFNYEINEK